MCPTEIIAFNDRAAEFEAIGCKVLACSVDSKFSHLAWTQRPRAEGGLGDMQIPIIADITKNIAKSYGVLVPDDLPDAGVALRGAFASLPRRCAAPRSAAQRIIVFSHRLLRSYAQVSS